LKLGGRIAATIVKSFHVFSGLGEGLLRIFLYLMKMINEVFNRFDGRVNPGKGTNVGVVTIIRVERSGFETSMVTVIEREFDYRKPIDPVILMKGYNGAEGLFNFLVGSFGLSVGLRMIRGG
jgi:hypothetical protein